MVMKNGVQYFTVFHDHIGVNGIPISTSVKHCTQKPNLCQLTNNLVVLENWRALHIVTATLQSLSPECVVSTRNDRSVSNHPSKTE